MVHHKCIYCDIISCFTFLLFNFSFWFPFSVLQRVLCYVLPLSGCYDLYSLKTSLKFYFASKEGRCCCRRKGRTECLFMFFFLRTVFNSSCLSLLGPQVLKPVVSPEVNSGLGNRRLINFSLSGRTLTLSIFFSAAFLLQKSFDQWMILSDHSVQLFLLVSVILQLFF